ncbi:MAG TPA: CdaR family protein [Pyrinomonadaceae bacterium]|nr:CdaR family protein [Pyrinomonadaceae bacterium]
MPSTETNPQVRRSGPLFLKHILSKIFLEDWATKLVALAITLALWLGVTGLSTPTTRRMSEIPLTLSYSNNTEITNSPIQSVSIVLSGDKRKVNQITESGLVVSLDLSDVPPGDRVVQLSPDNVSIDLPLGVKLQEIVPRSLFVKLEAVEEKELPVKVETLGDVPDGFEVYSETVVPQKVKVRGPSAYLRSLTSIPTDKIDLAKREEDFTARQIPVNLSNPKATPLESVVDVTFKIGEKRVEKIFQVVDAATRKKIPVTLFGPRSVMSDISQDDFSIERRKDQSGNESLQPILTDSAKEKGAEIRKPKPAP